MRVSAVSAITSSGSAAASLAKTRSLAGPGHALNTSLPLAAPSRCVAGGCSRRAGRTRKRRRSCHSNSAPSSNLPCSTACSRRCTDGTCVLATKAPARHSTACAQTDAHGARSSSSAAGELLPNCARIALPRALGTTTSANSSGPLPPTNCLLCWPSVAGATAAFACAAVLAWWPVVKPGSTSSTSSSSSSRCAARPEWPMASVCAAPSMRSTTRTPASLSSGGEGSSGMA
mmetsp:Transcript_40001/g.94300  ORF Transcript_40001/g.94300 Transcript_40001/m.94300 type:complete len:231 (+) Transcript_40001:687-1379(+)